MAIQNNPLTKHGILMEEILRDTLKQSSENHIRKTLREAVDKLPFSERLKMLAQYERKEEPRVPLGVEPIEKESQHMLASSFNSLKEKILSKFRKNG